MNTEHREIRLRYLPGTMSYGARGICRYVMAGLMALWALTSCASTEGEERWGVHKYKHIHWKEQVRLSSGEVIVVERGEKRRGVHEGGGPLGWLFEEAWLTAKLPGVGETRWDGALSPLVLDVTPKGEWYLLGVAVASRALREYRLHEDRRYVAFKLRAGAWQRVPFAEFPDVFKPNLLGDTYTLFVKRGQPSGTVVEFELKAKIDSSPTLSKEFKQIDRSLGE